MSSDHMRACSLLTFRLQCIIEAIYHYTTALLIILYGTSGHVFCWLESRCVPPILQLYRNMQYNTNRGCCAWVKPTLSHISTVKSINFWLLNDLEPRWCRHPAPRPHLQIDWVDFLDMVQNPQICCEEWSHSISLLLRVKMPSGSCTCTSEKTLAELIYLCQKGEFPIGLFTAERTNRCAYDRSFRMCLP